MQCMWYNQFRHLCTFAHSMLYPKLLLLLLIIYVINRNCKRKFQNEMTFTIFTHEKDKFAKHLHNIATSVLKIPIQHVYTSSNRTLSIALIPGAFIFYVAPESEKVSQTVLCTARYYYYTILPNRGVFLRNK